MGQFHVGEVIVKQPGLVPGQNIMTCVTGRKFCIKQFYYNMCGTLILPYMFIIDLMSRLFHYGMLWLLTVFFVKSSHCQSVSGKIQYVIDNNLAFDDDDGLYTMYFNQYESYFFNSTMPAKGSIVETGANNYMFKDGDIDGRPTYKNLKEQQSEQKHHIVTKKYLCIIIDTLPALKWKLLNEFKKISQFDAQKATCIYGGRVIDAWFTPQIPVSNGPYRLQGLPGMILEATSRDGKINVAFHSLSYDTSYHAQILPLTKKFNYEPLDYKTYITKKKAIEKRLILESQAEGWEWKPIRQEMDYQVEKHYFTP